MRVPARVLVHGEQRRRAAALDEHLAHAMARRLRRDHRDVDASRGGVDLAEADVEPVREHQRLAGGQMRRDVLAVERGCAVSGVEHHDDVGPVAASAERQHAQPVRLAPWRGSRALRGRPTRTSTPLSRRFSAWAWPCEP